jgi:hypothetical protein
MTRFPALPPPFLSFQILPPPPRCIWRQCRLLCVALMSARCDPPPTHPLLLLARGGGGLYGTTSGVARVMLEDGVGERSCLVLPCRGGRFGGESGLVRDWGGVESRFFLRILAGGVRGVDRPPGGGWGVF